MHTHTHFTRAHNTPTLTDIQVLQLSGDIEHAHRELDMGAEKYYDLQKKTEDQLHQLQVSFPSRIIPYLGKHTFYICCHGNDKFIWSPPASLVIKIN